MKPRYTLSELKAAAAGRWPEIHAALGIPTKLLNGKHQPCPYCGGKDRYRYTNHQNNGGFICNQCSPQGGSGFDLLMLVYGYDFQTASEQVASVLGMSSETMPTNAPKIAIEAQTQPKPSQDTIKRLTALWEQAKPIKQHDPVYSYLADRGLALPTLPNQIRHHPSLPYWHNGKQLGSHTAMIANITNTNGDTMGIHITYLQSDGESWHKLNIHDPQTSKPLPPKKMQSRYTGALKGAAVQLYQPSQQGRLMVAEGIETALAARELFNITLPVWACLSANGLRNFTLPPNISELVIIADHDHPRAIGYEAAHDLAIRTIKAGHTARIWQPEQAGTDALDELNRLKQA